MKGFLTFLFSLSSIFCFSQDYVLPKMNRYEISVFNWPDTVTNNQKEYWKNGNIKVEYFRKNDGKKIKKEYFEEGRLKLIAEVKQEYKKVIVGIMDTTGVFTEKTDSGYFDILDGIYIEYHDPFYSEKDIPLTKGQFQNGEMYDKWQTETGALGAIVISNYNIKGELDGEYLEYYDAFRYKSKIKWKGQFGMVKFSTVIVDPVTKKLVESVVARNERIGTWIQYDLGGNVITTVTYDWKK